MNACGFLSAIMCLGAWEHAHAGRASATKRHWRRASPAIERKPAVKKSVEVPTGAPYSVHILVPDEPGRNLSLMYRPILETIHEALHDRRAAVLGIRISKRVLHLTRAKVGGAKLSPTEKKNADSEDNFWVSLSGGKIVHQRNYFQRLGPGHAIILVGSFYTRFVPFSKLKKKGVYTILYQTEPWYRTSQQRCALFSDSAHELWDYSWRNIDNCKQSSASPRLRFVPPGFLPSGSPEPRVGRLTGYMGSLKKPCFAKIQNKTMVDS